MTCPECGCDWPCCENGCVSPWGFRVWKYTHYRAYRRFLREDAERAAAREWEEPA